MFINESGTVEFHGNEWNNESVIAKLEGLCVTQLHLIDTEVDDHFFERVPLEDLEGLYVSSSIIGDLGIVVALKRFRLTTLYIMSAKRVSDESMRFISECSSLREISLQGTRITNKGMPFLSTLHSLLALNISDLEITDDGLSSIHSRTIDRLSFENTLITGTGFSTWNLSSKVLVNANGSQLNDEGFSVMCEAFTHLWEIAISQTNVTDEGLKSLSGEHPINEFSLEHSAITVKGIEWLVENTEVGCLYVDASQVTDSLAEEFSKKGVELVL